VPAAQFSQLPGLLPTHPCRCVPALHASHLAHVHRYKNSPGLQSGARQELARPCSTHATPLEVSFRISPCEQVQRASVELPAGEEDPAGHRRQLDDEVAPFASDVEYFPASHCTHSEDPVVSLYLPALHAVHAPPLGPVYPLLHRHADEEELPWGDVDSAGQLPVHASSRVRLPTPVPKVPAGHGVQGPLSSP
jgi:hypothetical protein